VLIRKHSPFLDDIFTNEGLELENFDFVGTIG
jgi:hypothetical protein